MYLKISLLTFLQLVVIGLFAQQTNLWTDVNEATLAEKSNQRLIIPQNYRTLSLNLDGMKKLLSDAPMRFSGSPESEMPVVSIPFPDGSYRDYRVVEAPVMHPELASKYPGIKSFAGWPVDGGSDYLRFGYTQKGFHAMVLSSEHSPVFIDVYSLADAEHYISYYKADYHKTTGFECLTASAAKGDLSLMGIGGNPNKTGGDCQLRTYELALACTGEYAQFHGGTVPLVMAEFNVAMTRVNGIYEREVGVTMELVPNTDQLIFLDAATDPYTNNNGATMLQENQTTCDNIIGNNNYDIGHVFSTGGGGIANLFAVCNGNFKARGVTGLGSPVGDPFYVDYVAHEMGHQFGGNHTQNNNCNRNGSTAMEPGSASTIMGYAGICPPNVQNNSDDYFHAISIDEIQTFIQGGANSCPDHTATGNTAPVVTIAASSYNVPVSTPIMLTAEGSDPDGDPLTYNWDQMDNEVATMPPVSTNTGGPAFRSLSPTPDPTRYLPNINAILSGTTPTWEVLPSVSRTMNWRCTVRDNAPGAGCTGNADLTLNFSDSAGPFVVTQPNAAGITWFVGNQNVVNWDVANTDMPPVSTSAVDIYLSLDGGLTYPILLLENTPNDGQATVSVPNIPTTTTARIMVKGHNNVFFDISDENLTIDLPPSPTFFVNAVPEEYVACPEDTAVFVLQLTTVLGFAEGLNFTVDGLPQGTTASFAPAQLTPPGEVVLTITGTGNAMAGTYPLTINVIGLSVVKSATVQLTILEELQNQVTLTSPANGMPGIPFGVTTLTWAELSGSTSYHVEVATNPSFATTVATLTNAGNSAEVTGLQAETVYYWRVRGANLCGDGPWSATWSFQTGTESCDTFASTDVPVTIPSNSTGTVTSTIDIASTDPITSVQVDMDISHTWVGDLISTLNSPAGTNVILFDQPGVPASTFGCGEDDIVASFNDDAVMTAEDFENACSGTPPAIAGEFQPIVPLAALTGENPNGTWTLSLEDVFDEDGGSLNSWSLTICSAGMLNPASLNTNNPLTVLEGQLAFVDTFNLMTQDSPAVYVLLSPPASGELRLNNSALSIGDTFTQVDIINGNLSYQHLNYSGPTDGFDFDLLTEGNRWLPNQHFTINIIENTLQATATLSAPISCFGSADAEITVQVTGGHSPFSYSLNGGPSQNTAVFGNLGPGTYLPSVTDSAGFTMTLDSIAITEPAQLDVTAVANDNDVTATAAGGTPPYQYKLNGGAYQSDPTFPDLPNGTYVVGVQDANGCTDAFTVIVAVNVLSAALEISEGISCFGESDGELLVSVGGGTPPYQYSLNGGNFQNDPTFSNLGSGTYTVEVMDADGLTVTTNTVTLAAPTQLTANGSVNGYTVTISAGGGTPPYLYSLDGGIAQQGNEFFPVPPGMHTVTVVDANGCQSSLDVEVSVELLIATLTGIENVSCFGGSDGSITVAASGGVEPYSYSLNGGAFQAAGQFTNLSAGVYSVTAMDQGGFTFVLSGIVVDEPQQLSIDVSITGTTLTATAIGGTAPYQYSFQGGPFSGSDTYQLTQNGMLSITVLDANGCTETLEFEVSVPGPEVQSVLALDLSCFGANDGSIEIIASCQAQPCSYSLDNMNYQASNVFGGLSAGTYTVYVQDAFGSVESVNNIQISSPALLEADASVFGPVITVAVAGGTPPYQYSMDGSTYQNDNTFTVIANGDYTLYVLDANGCEATTTSTVNAPMEVFFNVVHVSCPGGADGEIVIEGVNGGYAPYLYSMNNGNFSDELVYTDLEAGKYLFVVMDSTGYQFEAHPVFIDEPAQIEVATTSSEDSLFVSATGGTGTLMYSLDGGLTFQDSPVFTNVPNGTYTLVVMDENGCTESVEVTFSTNAVNDPFNTLDLSIWPNPGNGWFILRLSGTQAPVARTEVFDVSGKALYTGEFETYEGNQTSFDLSHLPAGCYLVRVISGPYWGSARLIITK